MRSTSKLSQFNDTSRFDSFRYLAVTNLLPRWTGGSLLAGSNKPVDFSFYLWWLIIQAFGTILGQCFTSVAFDVSVSRYGTRKGYTKAPKSKKFVPVQWLCWLNMLAGFRSLGFLLHCFLADHCYHTTWF